MSEYLDNDPSTWQRPHRHRAVVAPTVDDDDDDAYDFASPEPELRKLDDSLRLYNMWVKMENERWKAIATELRQYRLNPPVWDDDFLVVDTQRRVMRKLSIVCTAVTKEAYRLSNQQNEKRNRFERLLQDGAFLLPVKTNLEAMEQRAKELKANIIDCVSRCFIQNRKIRHRVIEADLILSLADKLLHSVKQVDSDLAQSTQFYYQLRLMALDLLYNRLPRLQDHYNKSRGVLVGDLARRRKVWKNIGDNPITRHGNTQTYDAILRCFYDICDEFS